MHWIGRAGIMHMGVVVVDIALGIMLKASNKLLWQIGGHKSKQIKVV